MKYMMLINLGPKVRDFESLSEEEQKALAEGFQAINETPGVTPGTRCAAGDGDHGAGPGRPDAHHRRPVRRDQGGARRLLLLRGRRPRRGDRAGGADPGGAHGRRDRGAPDRGVVAALEQSFREQWGRVLAALIGFLGDFDLAEEAAQEAFAIAAERWPREGVPANPRALAGDDGAQPRDRPHPPRPHAGREDPPARGRREPMEDDQMEPRRPFPTSGSS